MKSLEELSDYRSCGHGVLMGTRNRDWQDTDYVLSCFGTTVTSARKEYSSFLAEGIKQGRRDELTGGGLIRSPGGWKEAARSSRKDSHSKSDERILGDSDFVSAVLARAEEQLERSYAVRLQFQQQCAQKQATRTVPRNGELKRSGYDLEKVAERAASQCGVEMEKIFSRGKQRSTVQARSLLCYWASRELGLSHTELARQLGISVPAVSYSVERGEKLAKEKGYRLIE